MASAHDINASFKDLCAVCDAVRYKPVTSALKVLDSVIDNNAPIEYRRHNKYMGSRHELQGKKGRYPIKCAQIVKNVIVNASANARNKGEDPESMYVVHAAANKTFIARRGPSKGVRAVAAGGYGYTSLRTSNLEYAKVEIGLADKDAKGLGTRMKRALKAVSRREKVIKQPEKKQQPKAAAKTPKPPEAPKSATTVAKQEPSKQQPKTEDKKV